MRFAFIQCFLHAELVAVIRRILNEGSYDEDGDFVLRRPEQATKARPGQYGEDYLEPEALAKAIALVAKIDKRKAEQ